MLQPPSPRTSSWRVEWPLVAPEVATCGPYRYLVQQRSQRAYSARARITESSQLSWTVLFRILLLLRSRTMAAAPSADGLTCLQLLLVVADISHALDIECPYVPDCGQSVTEHGAAVLQRAVAVAQRVWSAALLPRGLTAETARFNVLGAPGLQHMSFKDIVRVMYVVPLVRCLPLRHMDVKVDGTGVVALTLALPEPAPTLAGVGQLVPAVKSRTRPHTQREEVGVATPACDPEIPPQRQVR
jgi:hypothetical protein